MRNQLIHIEFAITQVYDDKITTSAFIEAYINFAMYCQVFLRTGNFLGFAPRIWISRLSVSAYSALSSFLYASKLSVLRPPTRVILKMLHNYITTITGLCERAGSSNSLCKASKISGSEKKHYSIWVYLPRKEASLFIKITVQ